MDFGKIELIACKMLEDEICAIYERNALSYDVTYVPEKLHVQPQKLREYLEELIEKSDADTLLFSIAQCGGATVGLSSKKATLIIPRCGDCIDLLLSSEEGILRSADASYYTASWLRYGNDFDDAYAEYIREYGKDNADYIIKTMYRNYRSFDLIDTLTYSVDALRPKVEEKASFVGCSVNVRKGPMALLEKLMTLSFDEKNFLILPPGETSREEMFFPDTMSLYKR